MPYLSFGNLKRNFFHTLCKKKAQEQLSWYCFHDGLFSNFFSDEIINTVFMCTSCYELKCVRLAVLRDAFHSFSRFILTKPNQLGYSQCFMEISTVGPEMCFTLQSHQCISWLFTYMAYEWCCSHLCHF